MALNNVLRKCNVTAKQISEQTGIKYGTVLKYSSGERKPGIQNAKKIAEILGVNWWELFEGKEESK